MKDNLDSLTIGDHSFESRLFVGTGKFSSGISLASTLDACGTQLVTVAMKRANLKQPDSILPHIDRSKYKLLPNTSGVRNAKEAVWVAQMAREALETNWLKLEIHPDPKYLMPDPIETLNATIELSKLGFTILPYCHADPVLCKQLEDAGAAAVMPLGSPIGSNQGLQSREFLKIIIEQARVPVVIDAGIGAPSHACEALELGADAVLVNTALATANHPESMGHAFKNAVSAGREAFLSGLGSATHLASPTSPLTGFLAEN